MTDFNGQYMNAFDIDMTNIGGLIQLQGKEGLCLDCDNKLSYGKNTIGGFFTVDGPKHCVKQCDIGDSKSGDQDECSEQLIMMRHIGINEKMLSDLKQKIVNLQEKIKLLERLKLQPSLQSRLYTQEELTQQYMQEDKLDKADIARLTKDSNSFKAQLADLNKEKQKLEAQIHTQTVAANKYKQTDNTQSSQLKSMRTQNNTLNNRIRQLVAEQQQLQSQIGSQNEQIQNQQKKIKKAKKK